MLNSQANGEKIKLIKDDGKRVVVSWRLPLKR
jgi:hypothetical protein